MLSFKEWRASVESAINSEVGEWAYKLGERVTSYNGEDVWSDWDYSPSQTKIGYCGDKNGIRFKPQFSLDTTNKILRVSINVSLVTYERYIYSELEKADWALRDTPYFERAKEIEKGIKAPYDVVISEYVQSNRVHQEFEFQHVFLENLLKQMTKPSRDFIEQQVLNESLSEEERDRMVLLSELLSRYPLTTS